MTCRKAREFLSRKVVIMEGRDFFQDPFSEAELRGLLKGRSPWDIFSWKSPSFKALGLEASSLGDDDLVRLMLREPRLIRRPLTLVGDDLIIGGDTNLLEKALESQ